VCIKINHCLEILSNAELGLLAQPKTHIGKYAEKYKVVETDLFKIQEVCEVFVMLMFVVASTDVSWKPKKGQNDKKTRKGRCCDTHPGHSN
jgi:hypothetical protein